MENKKKVYKNTRNMKIVLQRKVWKQLFEAVQMIRNFLKVTFRHEILAAVEEVYSACRAFLPCSLPFEPPALQLISGSDFRTKTNGF